MVEADVHYDGALRPGYDVRGVEAAAEAGLEHDDIAAPLREVTERERRAELELGAGVGHALRRRGEGRAARGEIRVRYVRAVHAHALVYAREVGRDVEPRAVSRSAEHAPEQGAGAALAVRAGDVDEAERILRAAEPLEELRNPAEPGL